MSKHVRPKLPESGRWQASANLAEGAASFIPWDLVAILAALVADSPPGTSAAPLFGEWEAHRVSLPPSDQGEPCDGTMTIKPLPVVVDSEAVDPKAVVGYHLALFSAAELGVDGPSPRLLDARHRQPTAGAVAAIDVSDHRSVVTVPHRVRSETALLEEATRLLCAIPAASPLAPPPPLLLGFVAELLLMLGATVAVLLATVLVRVERAKTMRVRRENVGCHM